MVSVFHSTWAWISIYLSGFTGLLLLYYFLANKQKNNKQIIGYGSPAKATTALNFFGISKEIKYIVEDNKLKQGKLLPGMKIPIVSKDSIKSKPNCVLVLAWNFFDEIKEKNKEIANKFINIKDLEG